MNFSNPILSKGNLNPNFSKKSSILFSVNSSIFFGCNFQPLLSTLEKSKQSFPSFQNVFGLLEQNRKYVRNKFLNDQKMT